MKAIPCKAPHFSTKTLLQKPLQRQIEWGVQNRPTIKSGVLPATTYFFENFISLSEPLLKSWFNVIITQMSIFILSISAWVLFVSAFSLWLTLSVINDVKKNLPELLYKKCVLKNFENSQGNTCAIAFF